MCMCMCAQFDAAEAALAAALAWSPGHADALYNYGLLCVSAMPPRPSDALAYFEQARTARLDFLPARQGAIEVFAQAPCTDGL